MRGFSVSGMTASSRYRVSSASAPCTACVSSDEDCDSESLTNRVSFSFLCTGSGASPVLVVVSSGPGAVGI